MYGKLLAGMAALLILAWAPPFGRARDSATQSPPGTWRIAPEYVRLFAPRRAHAAAYDAYVSPLDLDAVMRQLAPDPALLHPPGAWTPAALLPSDAFGQTGGYDRWRVERLYGARRAMVARGPRGEDGHPTQAWTLISPYPDPTLEHLEPGTLLIVLDLTNP